MITEHGATVLPFTDALLRAPKQKDRGRLELVVSDGQLPDNVIVLAPTGATGWAARPRARRRDGHRHRHRQRLRRRGHPP